MSARSPHPPSATSPTCSVLAAVLGPWLHAHPPSAGDEPQPVFVDAFASACGPALLPSASRTPPGSREVPLPPLPAPVLGSNAGAIRFVDDDPRLLRAIALRAGGLAATARLASDCPSTPPLPGETVWVTRELAGSVLSLNAMLRAPAFLWLAPARAEQLPWPALRSLLEREESTLLLRFPLDELRHQDAFRVPLADLPPRVRGMVEGCSALLGDPRHGWLVRWRQAKDGEAAEAELLARFAARLADAAPGRLVKGARLSSVAAAGACLFLVTALPEVAMAMNEAVRAGGLACEAILASTAAAAETVLEPRPAAVALDLFIPPPLESAAAAPRPPTALAVAALLLARCRGRTLSWGELVRELAEGELTQGEIRAGLLRLRREGWATFGSLRGAGAFLTLYAERHAPPRARKVRGAVCDLFCTCPGCREVASNIPSAATPPSA